MNGNAWAVTLGVVVGVGALVGMAVSWNAEPAPRRPNRPSCVERPQTSEEWTYAISSDCPVGKDYACKVLYSRCVVARDADYAKVRPDSELARSLSRIHGQMLSGDLSAVLAYEQMVSDGRRKFGCPPPDKKPPCQH